MLSSLKKNPLITGTLLMTAAGVLSRVIGFFYRIFLSRTIGADLLGLAFRSGNLVSGEFAAREAVRKKTAALIIVANDASDNTKKMFENQCKHYQVPFYCWGLKEELGHAIGKEFRASIAVTDQGFAEALLKQLDK